jgi:hypothetical protein
MQVPQISNVSCWPGLQGELGYVHVPHVLGKKKITNVQCKYNTRKRQKGPWHVTGEAPFAKGEEKKAKVYQQLKKNKNWQRSVRGRTDVLKRKEEDS